MISEIVQEFLTQISLRTLYFETAWFLTFGYLANLFLVMSLTGLPIAALFRSVFGAQLLSAVSSFILSPILAAIGIIILPPIFGISSGYQMIFAGQAVYFLFVICMLYLVPFHLCPLFITVKCRTFRYWLNVVIPAVTLLGFFSLKAMNLLIIL